MYSQDKMDTALKVYHQCGSIHETVRTLGYPSKKSLYNWIVREGKEKPPRKPMTFVNTREHPLNPPAELKLDAVHRCYDLGERVQSVSIDIGYTKSSIYRWRKEYLQGGIDSLINNNDRIPDTPIEEIKSSDPDMQQLPAQINDLQMEVDILKETINILKKDPGIDQTALKNREKAVIVDALKSKDSLPRLLNAVSLSKSSYYDQVIAMKKPDKYEELRSTIRSLFDENRQCYGYRRIHALLKRTNITVSEKIVRRIMHEESLTVQNKRRRKYSSYLGEISPAVPNKIERGFHADKPNQKWLTDVTEFVLPEGKIYLSALVDCFDGLLPSWTIGTNPNAKLVNKMLEQAISRLPEGDHPIIHSDRGCHYRWPGWINLMEEAGLERSMSQKSCTSDNAACEGFFGRLKNEMFYYNNWQGATLSDFIKYLNEYLVWYNTKRIKQSLGNLSPWEYRTSLGLTA